MATIAEVSPLALDLPSEERAELGEQLLESVSEQGADFVDEEVAERRAEMENDPSKRLTWEELMSEVEKLRDEQS